MITIIGATGHRPDKLGGFSDATFDALVTVAGDFLTGLPEAWEATQGVKGISGMALGWDQAFAQACVNCGIPFVAALPCDGQPALWPKAAKLRWYRLLEQAAEVVTVSPGPYAPGKMMARNKWMADRSDKMAVLWNGDRTGGTANCVQYAQSKNIPIVNLYTAYLRMVAVGSLDEGTSRLES